MDAEATGKLFSTAYVDAVVKRPSPNITAMTKSLVKEAEDQWKELRERSNTLLFNKNSIMPKAQKETAKESLRESFIWDVDARNNKKQADGVSATLRRDYADQRVRTFYNTWADTNASALANAFSDLKKIWNAVPNRAFRDQMRDMCDAYTRRGVNLWSADAKSLFNRWSNEYKSRPANYEVASFRAVYPTFVSTHNANISGDQYSLLQRFFTELRILWERTFLSERMADIERAMEAIQRETHSKDVYVKNNGTLITQEVFYPDVTTIRPFDVVHIEAEDAPMFRGYPTKPKLWARCTPLFSTEGEVIAASRALPAEVTLDSDQRWIAHDDYWFPDTGTWTAINNNLKYTIQAADLNNMPQVAYHEYVLGSEIINRSSFRIADGTKFLGRFNDGLDSLGSFTISMVIAPNPAQSAYPVLDYFYKGQEPADGDRMGWWLNDRLDFYYGGTGGSVDQLASMNKTRPLVITSVVTNGECTTYVGYSFRHNMKTAIKGKDKAYFQWLRFQIGGTFTELTEDQYADFNLYEVNLWTRPLDNDEVIALHSDYYSIYGVSNDWR